MGKVDDMRAMREARYSGKPQPVAKPQPVSDEVCGHRAISGKTCTRPKDHSEKNHRYT